MRGMEFSRERCRCARLQHSALPLASFQLTGRNPRVAHAFSSIRLGDDKAWLLGMSGPAFAAAAVPQIGGVRWSHGPFPISFELIGDTVYSIRIGRP